MSLPDLIEIVPLDRPVKADITVPGSKSITNRALILAALAEGEVTLRGALWSEDTQVMVECLRELGFMVNIGPDMGEPGNRTITVYGKGGLVPTGGTAERPLELFVGNAGTAARFLTALVCLGKGAYRLYGVPRMHERPQAALLHALRELGYGIDAPSDKLPALVFGSGPRAAKCRVSIAESSQFASALLLCAEAGHWAVEVTEDSADESPYVSMTRKLITAFPRAGGTFQVEPDASSASYFWAAGYLLGLSTGAAFRQYHEPASTKAQIRSPNSEGRKKAETRNPKCPNVASAFGIRPSFGSRPSEFGFGAASTSDWQMDAAFPRFLPLPPAISRHTDLGDSIMTAIVLAPFSPTPIRFTDLGRLRLQECERVAALRTELTRCGAKVIEEGDSLTVHPATLHGAEIETYGDHRMAMCFAILGLKVAGLRLKNPSCVKKTFPSYFQKLAALPPAGLGAIILDARSGRALSEADLFAD